MSASSVHERDHAIHNTNRYDHNVTSTPYVNMTEESDSVNELAQSIDAMGSRVKIQSDYAVAIKSLMNKILSETHLLTNDLEKMRASLTYLASPEHMSHGPRKVTSTEPIADARNTGVLFSTHQQDSGMAEDSSDQYTDPKPTADQIGTGAYGDGAVVDDDNPGAQPNADTDVAAFLFNRLRCIG